MGNNDKKKRDRKERLEKYRHGSVMPKITVKDKKFGKMSLWIMGGVIVASAIFFFSNMH